MILSLTPRETEVLNELATEMDLPPERVMIQALRLYQLYRAGFLVVKLDRMKTFDELAGKLPGEPL